MHYSLIASCLLLAGVASGQAPVLVQQVASSGTDLASLSVNLGAVPIAGDLLILCHDSTSGGGSAVSGGGVTNWFLCRSTLPADNSEIWAGLVDGTPDTAITITLGGSPNSASANVSEWQGLAAPLAFTGQITTGGGGTAFTDSVFAYPGDLVIATTGLHTTGMTIGAATNGFADLDRPDPQPSSVMTASWLVPAANGRYATSWSLGFSHPWASAIVVFRGPGPALPSLVQQAANSGERVVGLTLTLGQPPLPGDLLVLCSASSARARSVVSGGGVSQWTLCQSTLPGKIDAEIWAGTVDGPPDQVIAIALGGGLKGNASAIVSEWQGFASAPVFTSAAASGSNGTSSSPVAAGSLPAASCDLVIAAASVDNVRAAIGAPTNGFTELIRPPVQPSNVLAACWLLPVAQGAASTTWNLSQRGSWVSAIAVFHAP
jgi:hypothetical protein